MRAGAGLFALTSCLVSCALVFDFDDYRPRETPATTPPPVVAATDADFDLSIVSEVFIAPGGPVATLRVEVVRKDGTPRPVIVSVDGSLPKGLAAIRDVAIQSDSTVANLEVSVPEAPTTTQTTLHVVAKSGAFVHSRDVVVRFRGTTCTPDYLFGPRGNGTIEISLPTVRAVRDVFAAPSNVVVQVLDPSSGSESLYFFDGQGRVAGSAEPFVVPDLTGQIRLLDGGDLLFAVGSTLRRLHGDSHEWLQTFGSSGISELSCTISQFAVGTRIAAFCGDETGSWTVRIVSLDGLFQSDGVMTFPDGEHGRLLGVGFIGDSPVACGHVDPDDSGHGAVARFLPFGAPDGSFGQPEQPGLVRLEPDTNVANCIFDQRGFVLDGTTGVSSDITAARGAFFGIAQDGAPDLAFGPNGIRIMPDRERPDGFFVDGDGLLTIRGKYPTVVRRFLRDGSVDASFACNLDSQGDAVSALFPNRRIVIAESTSETTIRIRRLWL